MFKVNNKDTRTMPWRGSGVFIINFKHVSHLVLLFLLLTLSRENAGREASLSIFLKYSFIIIKVDLTKNYVI